MRGGGRAERRPPDVEVDVAVSWKGEPLLRRRVREGDSAWVGDVDGSWVRIPCEPIGVEGFRLARVRHGGAMALAPRGARGRLERPDGTVELFGSGREVWLLPGDVVRMGIGSFSIVVTGVAVSGSRAPGRRLRGWVQRFPGGQVGLSAVFHVAVLLVALVWPAGEERAAAEQTPALSEAELAAILAVGSEEVGEHRSGQDVGAPASEAPDEWEGKGGDGDGAAASAEMPGEAAGTSGGDGVVEGAVSNGLVVKGDTKSAAPWGWWAGGALALGGLGAFRWRRSRARAAGVGRWSWAGALELGRRVAGGGRVGVIGVAQEEVGAGGAVGGEGASLVVAGRVDLGWGSLDVVGVAREPDSGGRGLEEAWRAVRAGGVLVVAATSGDGGALSEQVRSGTGAAVVWWFERGVGSPGGLQTVVMAVKGRPSRGPKDVVEGCAGGVGAGGDARAIAAGFRGWGPFGEAAVEAELEEGRAGG